VLDRAQPMLPVRPGLSSNRSHDDVRHATMTLFAALEVVTGKVIDACSRRRHQEFVKFLKQVAKAYPRVELHVVGDNYAPTSTRRLSGGWGATSGSGCTSRRRRRRG
jgi:hypothetical protein